MAGLGYGSSVHSPKVGMAQDLPAAGAKYSKIMTAGRCYSPTMPAHYPEALPASRARCYRGKLRNGIDK